MSNTWFRFVSSLLPDTLSKSALIKRARACAIETAVREVLHQPDIHVDYEHGACTELYWITLQKVLSAFDDIRALILKGPILSERLFGTTWFRQTSDIDIWIAKEDMPIVDERLRQMGYCPHPPLRPWATNQTLYTPPNPLFLPVEIHWALTQPPLRTPDFEEAWQKRQAYHHQNIDAFTLDDTYTMLGLIFHALQHVWAIKPWIDLAAAVDILKIDENIIRRFGVYHIYHFINEVILLKPTYRARLFRRILRKGFCHNRLGTLIIGKDSALEAAFGATSRMGSMLFVDGVCYPVETLFFHIALGMDIIFHKLKQHTHHV